MLQVLIRTQKRNLLKIIIKWPTLAIPFHYGPIALECGGDHSRVGDPFYETRHPWIGEMVFKEAFKSLLESGTRVGDILHSWPLCGEHAKILGQS